MPRAANTTSDKGIRVLWIDDRVADYTQFVEKLRELGCTVRCVPTVAQGLSLLKSIGKNESKSYDLVLVDLKFPEANASGFDILDYLDGNRELTERMSICVFSSFLYQSDVRAGVLRHPLNVYVLDKRFGDTDSENFRLEFADRLKLFARERPKYTVQGWYEKTDQMAKSDPSLISYDDYKKLPTFLQRRLSDAMFELCRNELETKWQVGRIWALVIGGKIEQTADVKDKVWSASKIDELARRRNRAPFQYESDLVTEDCGSIKVATYPTMTIAKAGNGYGRLTSHFDTGTYQSHISLDEWLKATGVADISVASSSSRRYRGRLIHYLIIEHEEVFIFCQRTGRKKLASLTLRLVEDWLDSPFVVSCPSQCSAKSRPRCTTGFNCVYRTGLLGRDLIVENKMSITFDGRTLKTAL